MVKGLSEMQKKVLRIAYNNKRKHPTSKVDVSNRTILIKVYGFKPLVNINKVNPGVLVFDREDIGVKKYNSASVSVARCFNRLVARGLAEREYNQGIKLTDAGVKVVKVIVK